MKKNTSNITVLRIGDIIGQVAQLSQKNKWNKTGDTLYSTFITISDMKLIPYPAIRLYT